MCGNIICSICYANYRCTDEIIATACGHIFHKACLPFWINRSPICPQCPQRISFNGERRIFPQFTETTDSKIENKLREELEKCKNFSKEIQYKLSETEILHADLLERFQLLQIQSKRDQTLQKTYQQSKEENSTFSSMNSTIKSSTFSSVNSTIKSSSFNEAHWCTLIKTLEDELNILSKQLNIELNFTHQKRKDELGERILNLIKNVSFMVRLNVKKGKRSETQLYRESEKDPSQSIDYSNWASVLVDRL